MFARLERHCLDRSTLVGLALLFSQLWLREMLDRLDRLESEGLGIALV